MLSRAVALSFMCAALTFPVACGGKPSPRERELEATVDALAAQAAELSEEATAGAPARRATADKFATERAIGARVPGQQSDAIATATALAAQAAAVDELKEAAPDLPTGDLIAYTVRSYSSGRRSGNGWMSGDGDVVGGWFDIELSGDQPHLVQGIRLTQYPRCQSGVLAPKSMTLVDSSDLVQMIELELRDGPQYRPLTPVSTTSLRLFVDSVYEPDQGCEARYVGVYNLQVYGR